MVDLPATMFSGCFPSLRDLSLPNSDTWPIGLFKRLTSFECGDVRSNPIPPVRVLDLLRESSSIEFIRLMGSCTIPPGFQPPAIPLPSLKECALNGPGTTTLIRFMIIPTTAHVSLKKMYRAEFPRFEDFSAVQGLHVLEEVSTISVSAKDLEVRFQAENINGGVLEAIVDDLGGLWEKPTVFSVFLKGALHCTRTHPGFKTTKVLTLNFGRGVTQRQVEAGCFKLDVVNCIQSLPEVEEVHLKLPWLELYSVLLFLGDDQNTQNSPPNVRRLHIKSFPLPSPRPLLLRVDELLTKREGKGVPFHSVTVVIECGMVLPATDHCAFLTSWERLVEGDVRLEYEKPCVRWPLKSRGRNIGDEDGDKWDSGEKNWDEGGDGEGCCVGWDGWPEWLREVEEMRKG